MDVLTTTLAEVSHRRIAEVLSVVLGEGDSLSLAFEKMEEMATIYEADAVIDLRTTAVGAGDGVHRAQFRWAVMGTAVRLEPVRPVAEAAPSADAPQSERSTRRCNAISTRSTRACSHPRRRRGRSEGCTRHRKR